MIVGAPSLSRIEPPPAKEKCKDNKQNKNKTDALFDMARRKKSETPDYSINTSHGVIQSSQLA